MDSAVQTVQVETTPTESGISGWWALWIVLGIIFIALIIWLIVHFLSPSTEFRTMSIITPIAPPSNVTAVVGGTDTVIVSWTPPMIAVDRYRIFYGRTPDFQAVGTGVSAPGRATSQQIFISNPEPGNYYVRMQSIHTGVASALSNPSNAFSFAATPPPTPGDVTTVISRANPRLWMSADRGDLVTKFNDGLISRDFQFRFEEGTLTHVAGGGVVYVDHHNDVKVGTVPADLRRSGNDLWTWDADREQMLYQNDPSQALAISSISTPGAVILSESGMYASDHSDRSEHSEFSDRECRSEMSESGYDTDSTCSMINPLTQWTISL